MPPFTAWMITFHCILALSGGFIFAFSPPDNLKSIFGVSQIQNSRKCSSKIMMASGSHAKSVIKDLDGIEVKGLPFPSSTTSLVSDYLLENHNATLARLRKKAKARSKANQNTSKRPFHGSRNVSQAIQPLISEAPTSREMVDILEKHKLDANYVNIAAALHKCAQIYGGHISRNRKLSYIQVGPEVERDLKILLAMSVSVMKDFQGRQLSNIIWSLGKLRIKNKDIMIQLTTRLLFTVDGCNSQELAMAAWGFATLRFHSKKFFNLLGKKVAENPDAFCSQNIALIIWAFAQNGYYHMGAMEAISETIDADPTVVQAKFSPKDLSMLAWGYVSLCQTNWKLQKCSMNLLAHISSNIIEFDRIRKFKPHDLAQISLAYARLGYLDEDLQTLIASASLEKLDEFTNQEKSNLAWAFARLHWTDSKALFQAIAKSLKPNVADLKTQELANLAWAFVVLEFYDEEFLSLLFTQASKRSLFLADEELRQFYQAYTVLKSERPDIVKGVPRRFFASTKGCWVLEKMRNKESSARHTAISKVFNDMGIYHCNEDENDIDIALQHKQFGKVAVEIDGPAHFACNSNKSLGHTSLKHKILTLKGWQLVQIPYYEWDRIPFWSSMEKRRYIQRKLQIKEDVVYSKSDWSSYRAYPSTGQTTRYD